MDTNINVDLKEGAELLINPLVDPSALLEKIKGKVVYNPRLGRHQEVMSKIYVFPVYLPEYGILLSLDITSDNLARTFYDLVRNYEGIRAEGTIIRCRIHRFRKDENRVVSWGAIKPATLNSDLSKLYVANLINDFYLTPSTIKNGCIWSPHRWFHISSHKDRKCMFEAIFNYNFGVVYIKRENIHQRKIKKVWLNSPIKLYEVIGGFISFHPTGFVDIKKVPLHFTEDPVEMNIFLNGGGYEGDYFVCFLISFNNYLTPYEDVDIKSGNINLVETLLGLVYSPYEILPLLFPFMVKNENLEKLIYCFNVDKEIFKKIIGRLTKFGAPQNLEFIRSYESLLMDNNRLLNVKEENDNYCVEIANPTLIPFLLKKLIDEKYTRKSDVEKILREQNILMKIKELDERFREEDKRVFNLNLSPLYGIPRYLTLRKKVLTDYIHIVQTTISHKTSKLETLRKSMSNVHYDM